MKRFASALLVVILTCSTVSALNRYHNEAGDLMITDKVLTEKEMADGGWVSEVSPTTTRPAAPAAVAPKKSGNSSIDYWSAKSDELAAESKRLQSMTSWEIQSLIERTDASIELLKGDTSLPISYKATVMDLLAFIKKSAVSTAARLEGARRIREAGGLQ